MLDVRKTLDAAVFFKGLLLAGDTLYQHVVVRCNTGASLTRGLYTCLSSHSTEQLHRHTVCGRRWGTTKSAMKYFRRHSWFVFSPKSKRVHKFQQKHPSKKSDKTPSGDSRAVTYDTSKRTFSPVLRACMHKSQDPGRRCE